MLPLTHCRTWVCCQKWTTELGEWMPVTKSSKIPSLTTTRFIGLFTASQWLVSFQDLSIRTGYLSRLLSALLTSHWLWMTVCRNTKLWPDCRSSKNCWNKRRVVLKLNCSPVLIPRLAAIRKEDKLDCLPSSQPPSRLLQPLLLPPHPPHLLRLLL